MTTFPECLDVLKDLVGVINNAGGVTQHEGGVYALADDEDWVDLAYTAIDAHHTLLAAGWESKLKGYK